MKHSLYSPSAAHRWMRCAASLQAAGLETGNEYTQWGHECHEIAARMLLTGIYVPQMTSPDEQVFTAANYVAKVKEVVGTGTILGVEMNISFGHLLPEAVDDQAGTVDCVALSDNGEELQIHDLKTGKGVIIDAEDNEQLMIYACAAMDRFGMVADIQRVRLCIHQQRAGHYSEHVMTGAELMNFGEAVRERISEIEGAGLSEEVPGEKQCRFCARKAQCKAYEQFIWNTVAGEFVDLTSDGQKAAVALNAVDEVETMGANRLPIALAALPMIEQWCKAVRAKALAELLADKPVEGFKLVRGKRGSRQWTDDTMAVKILKSMKLTNDEMYTLKVISPTSAEKLLRAGHISAKQFERLKTIITQSEGALSVAPQSDKRPAATPIASDSEFTDETENLEMQA